MKIIDLYMLWTLVKASLIAIFALSIPVVLISLNSQVQVFAIPAALLWQILIGTSTIIIFHTIPILASLAIIWVYARFWSEGIVVSLYMAGRSSLGVALPALAVALVCTLSGYAIAGFFKPFSESVIHDVMYKLRREIDLNLIKYGKFNYFDNGRTVIYIRKKLNDAMFEGVYLSKLKNYKGSERQYREHYYARYAIMSGSDDNRKLVLADGSMIDDSGKNKRYDFKYITTHSAGDQALTARSKIFYDELTTSGLMDAQEQAYGQVQSARLWLREAVKRLVMPLLSLTHTMFALGLLNLFGAMMGRGGSSNLVIAFVSTVMFAFHLPIVFMIEAISIRGLPLAALVLVLVALQAVLAVVLFAGAQNLRLQTMSYAVLSALANLFSVVRPRPSLVSEASYNP